jgi:hypothetical protein
MSATVDVAQLVQPALERYSHQPAVPFDDRLTPENFYLATPDRTAFALGWLVASAIVEQRFLDSAIDVLPIFHPEHGWDRFVITRRVSCAAHQHEPADKFGLIMLSGDDAPRLTSPSGRTKLALGQALRDDPADAIAQALAYFPPQGLSDGRHTRCPHRRAVHYPDYYRTVAALIAQYPGLVASREVYVDDQQIDGQFHPLYLHATEVRGMSPSDRYGVNVGGTTYDWFQLQYGELFGFFDIYGERAIYRTERAGWARVLHQVKDDPPERLAPRIAEWLHLDAVSEPPVG